MTKQALAGAMCGVLALALAACGGGGSDEPALGDGDNEALNHSFNYGGATNASSTQANVMQSGLSSVVTLRSTPSAAAAVALAQFGPVTSTLLGSSVLGRSDDRGTLLQKPALDSSCVTVTATTITYDNCTSVTSSGTSVIDGSFTISADGRTLTWDLTITVDVSVTNSTATYRYNQSGTVTVTDTTIVGNMLAKMDLTATYGGTTISYGLEEALILDLVYQANPVCVTSGTLEARRVWTKRPNGLPASSFVDRAAKVTWTGCNQATIAISN